jgi:peroxiredoxin
MEIGQKAPEISLVDTDKNIVSLSDFKGRNIILLFFPLAFTNTCTIELCKMRDNISIYDSLYAEVLGVSVDSFYTLAKYKEEQQLNFKLLSDFNKDASKAFDVLYDSFGKFEMKGVSKRAAFIIDKEGIIRYAEVCASASDLPDFNAIKIILQTLN